MSIFNSLPATIALGLALINFLTVLRFWQDKQRAIHNERRIAEADLLMLAFFGGTPGAYFARQIFRHKTRKQPFSNLLFLIVVLQVSALTCLLVYIA